MFVIYFSYLKDISNRYTCQASNIRKTTSFYSVTVNAGLRAWYVWEAGLGSGCVRIF